MKIILHIGWHKTGSTAVQSFLKNNYKILILDNKIYYPREGMVDSAHHKIAWAVKGANKSPWGDLAKIDAGLLINRAIKKANKLGCKKVIFSSEEFCTLTEEEIAKLKEILSDGQNETFIVAYIRRQDLLIESSYKMEVKWWGSRITESFSQYVKNKTPFIKYDLILDSWANVFGLNNTKVRIYNPDYLTERDIRADFCCLNEIDYSNLTFDANKINQSIGSKSVVILRILNRLKIPRETHKNIVSLLQRIDNSSEYSLFNTQQRIDFMKALNESNKNLNKYGVNTDLLIVE